MDTRRDFLKKAMLLSGAAGWNGLFPESIQKAMAIDPVAGSTYLDAEHVVILMQENRSFDHCFGTLKGVRGFNDPRAVSLPDRNKVWLQSNAKGETYAPFRLDIRDTKITWMGSIPHVRSSQVDAFNGGRHDKWLDSKRSHNKEYADMPLTMGHYTRDDLPFNYALADAFTVCDQNFCSGMTSTWPNRLFLWTGKVRAEQNGEATAHIRNDVETGEISWTTFPELLEDAGVSWRVYQNDLTVGGGFKGEERAWLANFGCNLLEPFAQYNVRYSLRYVQGLRAQLDKLPGEIEKLQAKAASLKPGSAALEKVNKEIDRKSEVLAKVKEEAAKWTPENFDKLSAREQNLYKKAFTINDGDPHYHELDTLEYVADGKKREMSIPKGDVLHQFREDVNNGKLPAVSWLVGPENFSDHPTAPWYGAWYVSEVLDILTKNPEVWKKTIFILTYDENDGYFDHIPPFVAPDPKDPGTGKCSEEIDTTAEYMRRDKELAEGISSKEAREAPAGLGFRVPMVIASPWSRGGRVCSQVFDHTSVIRFVQGFLNRKAGKELIRENNISEWRKTVSGDLTSIFQPFDGGHPEALPWLQLRPFAESIHDAKFKDVPANFHRLSADEIRRINEDPYTAPYMANQEPGIKLSCALPYELYADGGLSADKKSVVVTMKAGKDLFGERSAGCPFNIHLPGAGCRSYAVRAGDRLEDSFPLADNGEGYLLRLHGPNGFFREYGGNAADPGLIIEAGYDKDAARTRKLALTIRNDGGKALTVRVRDEAYGNPPVERNIAAGETARIVLNTEKSYGWYDFMVLADGYGAFGRRYAGRVENGAESYTDPYMGRVTPTTPATRQ